MYVFLQAYSKRVVGPSNGFLSHLVHEVPKEVKNELEDLKETAEGDAKPERETTTQRVEEGPVLGLIYFRECLFSPQCCSRSHLLLFSHSATYSKR